MATNSKYLKKLFDIIYGVKFENMTKLKALIVEL